MNNATQLTRQPQPSDLTIAICTIGRDGFLQTALRTVLETTPPGVTIHVVLNEPPDQALAGEIAHLIEPHDGPTAVTTLTDRLTIAGSHNTALTACTTDFITFMGDDDLVLEPRIMELLNQFWNTTPTPAVIGSYCRRVSGGYDTPRFSTNKDYGPTTMAEWEDARDSGELIEIVFPSAVYRTELLRSIGGFEERFGSAMDLATFTILGQDHPVLANPRRSFAHRIHDGSVTSSSARQHAERLSYTVECVAAVRAGEPQPTWDEFVAQTESASLVSSALDQRVVMSATLFRQGGAAAASGKKATGIAKMAVSGLLSPKTFLQRSRSQVEREDAGQSVVTVLVKQTNHHRVPFYERLREELRSAGIELRIVSGTVPGEDDEQASLHWAESRGLRQLSVGGKTLVWQSGFDVALGADLIIAEHAAKQLFNTVLAFGQRGLRTRFAFLGHGKNFQASVEGAAGDPLRGQLTSRAHWFFANNDLSAQAAVEAGIPPDRVTPVMNATDTGHIRRVLASLPADTDQEVRRELGIGGGPVVLSMGTLSPLSRPQFLVDAAIELRRQVPDVEVVVIGGGSSEPIMAGAGDAYEWFHAIGPVIGDERIRIASIASLQVLPGLIELNIVDGFGLGLPTITTDVDYHSPEIDYLDDGANGIMVHGAPTPAQYASVVAETLTDSGRLATLQAGAEASGEQLTIEAMAQNVAAGIRAALNAPTRL